jgi:DNA-binding MarR family transcriptional regulator
MSKIDAARVWSLNYRLLMSVITGVAREIAALGLEPKELFLLGAVDEHPYPAELATELCIPKPTVSVTVKRLQAAGMLRREIDPKDLRRHRLTLTATGRRTMSRGMELLSQAFGARLERLSANQRGQLAAMLEQLN